MKTEANAAKANHNTWKKITIIYPYLFGKKKA